VACPGIVGKTASHCNGERSSFQSDSRSLLYSRRMCLLYTVAGCCIGFKYIVLFKVTLHQAQMNCREFPAPLRLKPGHTGWTHEERTRSTLKWVVPSSSSFVTRSSSALDQRFSFVAIRLVRRDFCACSKLGAELGT